jgi:hypothetical protein
MLVKNNLPTVLDFGNVPHGTKLHDPGGKNHGVFIPALQLMPGANEVDPEAWEMWTTGRAASVGAGGKPAGLNWHLAQKNVEVVKVEVEAPDKDGHSVVKTVSADDFADLKADDAVDLVKETFDIAMLKVWLAAEEDGKDRITVESAIDDQIEMLGAQVAGTENE